jgi:outer membrane scaffolding protein for murein synthesis (MipA/OmpV family)
MRPSLRIVIVLVAAVLSTAASAQTPSPFPYWTNAAGVVMMPLAGPPPEWQTAIGGGAVVMPLYEGSHSYHALPAPEIDIRYYDLAFISSGDGIGVNLLHGQNYRAGVAMSYDTGREHNLATRLSGTGNVDPTPEAKLFAEAYFKPLGDLLPLPIAVSANLRQAPFGHQGMIGDLGFYVPIAGNKAFDIFVGPSVTFADHEYMQSYFGISANHAAPHSIFPQYTANGGLKDASFGVTMDYRFSDHWAAHGAIGYERLMASAGNSPLVQEKSQLGSALTLGYTF